jgi:hypothetical protein
MLEKPDIKDELIISHLRAEYGLRVVNPLGLIGCGTI